MPAATRAQLDTWRAEIHALRAYDAPRDYATDPVAFATEALGIVPDDWQRDVLAGDWQRILLNCSRQSGKSLTTAILALHELLYRPGAMVVVASPSLRQSAELYMKVAELRDRLPWRPQLTEGNRLSMRTAAGARIVSLPANEATTRGLSSVTLLIEDEASRVPDRFYIALRPMLAVTRGRLALLSTPNGQQGHFHAEWAEGSGWERVRVPATECPRISAAFLEEERAALGDRWYRQEYMTEFEASEDSVFRPHEIDAAFTNDVTPLFGAAA